MSDDNIMELMDRLSKGGANIGTIIIDNHGTMNINGNKEEKSQEAPSPSGITPSFEEMMQVFKIASKAGLWRSMRSWGVGYQMWKIWGYQGTIQDYVRLVTNSPDAKQFDYMCNVDAVYKMMSKGHMSHRLENWRRDGVLEPYCLLGDKINEELLKLYPVEEIEDQ